MQGVDIFSKDFLFIPIHDALHWSLVIVCHPGLDLDSERKPYILHLDSMQGGSLNSDAGTATLEASLILPFCKQPVIGPLLMNFGDPQARYDILCGISRTLGLHAMDSCACKVCQ